MTETPDDTTTDTTETQAPTRRTLLKAAGGAAAASGVTAGTAVATENTIKIVSTGEGVATYLFCVSGKLKQTDDDTDFVFSKGDTNCAQGYVDASPGSDTFTFKGQLKSISLDGPAKVIVNGQRIDPSAYPDAYDPEKQEKTTKQHQRHDDCSDWGLNDDWNRIVLRGDDPSAAFKICVTGLCHLPWDEKKCVKSTLGGCGCGGSPRRVKFKFTGEVRELELQGAIEVRIVQI